jgi:dienelactone hydrolase
MKKIRLVAVSLMLCLGLPTALLAQAPTKLPIELFFKNGDISGVSLSPSGKYLAVNIRGKSGRMVLGIAETANLAKVNIIVKNDDIDVVSAYWLTEDRLIFSISNRLDLDDRRSGNTYVINRDGSNQSQPIQYRIIDAMEDGTEDLLVSKSTRNNTDGSLKSVQLFRLDAKKDRTTPLLKGLQPKDVVGWLMDKDKEPRFAFASEEDETVIHYRAPGRDDWTEISRFNIFDPAAISPEFIDGSGTAYVSKQDANGFAALYTYDPVKRQVGEQPLLSAPGFDIDAEEILEDKTDRLLGVRYLTDARNVIWYDPILKEIQKTFDDNFPATINRLTCRGDPANYSCVVFSYSDQNPGQYYLFRPATNELASIGAIRPKVIPEQMATKSFYRYAARDGMQIPVYVTMPPGKASSPRPAVVMVHGGPTVRGGSWGWDADAQFLASRGYVVIEPEFRGSTGFGRKHEEAGRKKWGLEMQDDITDVTHWAIDKGWVDKNRVAIAGASYGGYATLMGLIKTPELFRAGINWVGVTDIDLLFTVTWSDLSDKYARYGSKVLIGDPAKDAERFKATSPLAQHERLKKPLLMGYGASDVRVPLVHGTKFRDAVSKHNPNVDMVVYDKEGHGWRLEKNNYDWWTRVETFLEANMKP